MAIPAESIASTARVARHPIHPMLVPFPIVCFIGALVTDIAYYATAEMTWADFSAWLLVVGVIMGVLAAIAGLIDFLGNRLIRAQPPAWPHLIGNILVLVLSFFNVLIHRGMAGPRWCRSDLPFDHRRPDPADHRLARLVDGISARRRSGSMRRYAHTFCAPRYCAARCFP